MNKPQNLIKPGQTVTVTQQIPHSNGAWTTHTTGEVVRLQQRKTGSWYAHAKDDKLWLDRLTLRKDDGEIIECILDRYTQVLILHQPPPPSDESAPVAEPLESETDHSNAA